MRNIYIYINISISISINSINTWVVYDCFMDIGVRGISQGVENCSVGYDVKGAVAIAAITCNLTIIN